MRHTTHCTIAARIFGCSHDRISVVRRVETWRQLLGSCLYLVGVKRLKLALAMPIAHAMCRRELLPGNRPAQIWPSSWSDPIATFRRNATAEVC
jgi:hypothetical protein